jgi:hypothetical protein
VSKRGGLVPARLGVVLGALAGLALTLPFALASHEAYGSGGLAELVPAGVSPWLFEHGLLGADSEAVYDRYGVAYLMALGLVTASLFVFVRPIRGGRRVVLVGLVVLCLGILGDYAVANDIAAAVGYLLEWVGFLVVAVGVGLAVRGRVGALAGAGAALATLACMAAGGALIGHFPSGPGLTILLGALTFALLVDVRRDGADVADMLAAVE